MARSITYGVPTDRCGLQLRLGIEKGFFRELGIDLSLRVVFGGPEISAEFDSGRLKIGELGTPPALTAMGKGARFKIIGSGVRRGAVQYFVARPKMSAWSNLHGAKLGVLSRGSCSDWYMREVLEHYGLDPETDVTIVGLGSRYPEILTLLAQGDLDGAIISEPHVTIGEQAGYFKVWLGLNKWEVVPRMQSQTTRRWSMTAISSRPCLAGVGAAIGMPRTIAQNGQILAPAISASRATPWRSRSIASSAICTSIVRSIARGWKLPSPCSVGSEA
jgi:hypothetical protein